jgi:hypothetical protein
MKKTFTLLAFVVILSLVLSACSPSIIYAQNDQFAPGFGSGSAVSAQFIVTENIVPVRNQGTLVYAPMGAETGINVVVFRPDVAAQMLLVIPMGGSIALMDGPEPGPADVVAVIYAGSQTVAIIILANLAAHTAELVFEGLDDVTTTVDVGYLPMDPDHNRDHDVASNLTQAQAVLTALDVWVTAGYGGGKGPGNDVRCIVMKASNSVVRFIVWTKTHISVTGIDRGTLLIWHAVAPDGIEQFADTYTNKSAQTLLNVPQDLKSNANISMEEWDCNRFPPAPPLPGG